MMPLGSLASREEILMTQAAQQILSAFEALEPGEQHEVAVAIIRRSAACDDISDASLDELAGELFRSYDAEEAARDQSKTR
jgi:hypothetical protein